MDVLFGVVNIPNVVWIDEAGMIVRPPEPGWPGGRQEFPKEMRDGMSPADVVAASEPRNAAMSQGAAHFELANHLWQAGDRDAAVEHFNACHRLQPDNWTYQRQAWSLFGQERVGGDFGRFVQGPLKGEEDAWPFDSDFRSEVSSRAVGSYYPKTL
jgi:hypothetical protein